MLINPRKQIKDRHLGEIIQTHVLGNDFIDGLTRLIV